MSITENNQNILKGTLVFTGTRVPVQNLFDYLDTGDSITNFLEDFSTVSLEQVRHLLQSAEMDLENNKDVFVKKINGKVVLIPKSDKTVWDKMFNELDKISSDFMKTRE